VTHRLLAALLLACAAPALAQAPQGGSPPAATARPGAAQTAPASQVPPTAAAPSIPYEMYRLPNGLEVVLSKDERLPVVTVNVWYHVGALHEQQGRTGFAHLFEHMMFQGSKHVGDDVHISRLEQLGATDLNGTTNFDRTNYYETVPSNHLETALWMESDRMGFLLDALTGEKLKTQQEVVKNERRQRTETAEYGLAEERWWQTLFPPPHPYSGVIIGSMKDLEAASLEDVRAFFARWYAPANATLTIAGDFDEARARQLVEKYFGSLPGGAKPPAPQVQPVALAKPVEQRFEEPIANTPKVFIGWLSPAIYKEGDASADVLASILSAGRSSRLYERLVYTKRVAQTVSAYQQSLGAQSLFAIEVTARPGVTTERLVAEVDAVLQEVREQGVRPEEVQRVRNRIETGIIRGLQQVSGKAEQLQSYNHYLGDPGRLQWDLARYESQTPETVRDFARQVLTDKRSILHAIPAAAGPAAAARPQEGH
jgi:predicted Zn-dependent peptidase